jgi:predicted membrane-bound spermidine synthase
VGSIPTSGTENHPSIAQLVEQLPLKQLVAGSNPAGRTFMQVVLKISAFASGALLMIIEIVGSRVIAPYLGTSTITWVSIIGVILTGLSIGYYTGGRIADKHQNPQFLAALLFGSALFSSAIIPLSPFLEIFSGIDLRITSTIGSIILFGPVSIIFGMISPYIARLSISNINSSGSVVGTLYALSTLGSIIGTFLGGYILISFIGTREIILSVAILLFVLSLVVYISSSNRKKIGLFTVILFILFVKLIFSHNDKSFAIAEVESVYNRWFIYESVEPDNRPSIVLANNIFGRQSAVYKDKPEDLVFTYLRQFDLISKINPKFETALLLGAGAYTYPLHFQTIFPDKKLDVVEIDPSLKGIAKEFFFYTESENAKDYIEDARTFLNKNEKKYDVVLVDVFSSNLSVPSHMVTSEAVTKIFNSLSDNGVVIMNIISTLEGEGNEFLKAEYKTYKSVFPHVVTFPTNPERPKTELQNIILIGSKNSFDSSILEREIIDEQTLDSSLPVLTDNFAPIEKYTIKYIK